MKDPIPENKVPNTKKQMYICQKRGKKSEIPKCWKKGYLTNK